MIKSMLRGIIAIALGFLVTGLLCGAGVVLGITQFVLRMFGVRCQYQALLYKGWAWCVHEICVARILGAKTIIEGAVRPAASDELVLVIGNHPTTAGTGSFAWLVIDRVAERVMAVAKQEHQRTPIGWCMTALGSAIYVDRSDGAQSAQAIGDGLRQELTTPCAIVLFPDVGRPSQRVIAADIQKFSRKIAWVGRELTETRAPRSGGLYHALQALQGRKLRVVLIVNAMCPRDWTLWDVCRPGPRTLRYELREIQLPATRKELEPELNVLFQRLNALIRWWRATT